MEIVKADSTLVRKRLMGSIVANRSYRKIDGSGSEETPETVTYRFLPAARAPRLLRKGIAVQPQ